MSPQAGTKAEIRSPSISAVLSRPVGLKLFRDFENLLGCLSVFLVAIFAIVATCFLSLDRIPLDGWVGYLVFAVAMLLFVVSMIVDAVLLCKCIDMLRSGVTPLPLVLALPIKRRPVILRSISALWWAAHFLVGILIALKIELSLALKENAVGLPTQIVAFFAISFSLAFAFNLFAMLALSATGLSPRWILRVWKCRVLFDFVIAIAATVLATKGYTHKTHFWFMRPIPGWF